MTCAGNILSAGTILNSKDTLRDHLTSVGADDMDTKYPVSLLLGDDLDGTLRVQVGLGTGVSSEGELSDLVLNTSGLEFLLSLTDPSDLGVSVNDGGDSVVVHVAVAGLDVLDGGDTFLFGFVGKHRSESDVTDTFDALDGSVELVIDNNTALRVDFDANLVETKTVGVGTTADRDENDISVKLVSL